MNALAITDHGNLHGAIEFYKVCKSSGLNPIIGYEAYMAPGSRHDKSSPKDGSYHLTLLCQNRIGFQNLIKMASAASLEGYYFKPRLDRELLETYREGIVCLSGCVSSEFSQAILRGGAGAEAHLDQAAEIATWFRGVFGDRYFIEIMNNGVAIQRTALEGSVEIANRLGIPLVATSDCHYVDPDDADAQDVMLCINTARFRTDTNRLKMDGQQYYLRSPEEMYAKFPGLESAVARSQEIADAVDIQLELGKRHFPVYKLPAGETADDRLRQLCLEGLRERYADDPAKCVAGELAPEILSRLDRELTVIRKLGFSNYFLICWDFVNVARQRNIPATARGSGVGALVCYALYISHVCPIRFGLLFERFLDESRIEAPDIDIDFCKDRRSEIIRYVKEKYGADNVAQICTFGTLKAKAAIKDVGRALGIPLARVNQISALVPEALGIRVEEAVEQVPELKQAYQDDPEVRDLIDFALKLEGLARNVGTHAAAVVIGDRPLTEYLPLCRVTGNDDVITQWAMADVEAAGLLKMDFLGLRNLTILSDALDYIEKSIGQRLDIAKIPLDDPATFALLQRGETKGVFQLESGGIRDLLQKMRPDRFEDIIATNALYRPGPLEGGMVQQYIDVKLGRKKGTYKHPVLREILEETHGVMVYQEQVMKILNVLGRIDLAAAYTCIKAISKKNEKKIAENYEQFMQGAVAFGLKRGDAEELWQMILKFAGYGFNKSHSTAYALLAYQTAYLKSHFPIEFMAALLTGDIDGRNWSRKDSLGEHLDDCRRMGIAVEPPDINRSHGNFRVSEGKILFALTAIKGCGGGTAAAIVAERESGGLFRNLFDFCERMPANQCSRSTIETLIKAGAFDSFKAHRAQLLAALDKALAAGAAMQADRRSGQKSLFGDSEDEPVQADTALPDVPEMDHRQLLAGEKEVLGFYWSSHPLAQYEKTLLRHCSHTTEQIANAKDREGVAMGGLISAIKYSHVKRSRDASAPTKYAMFDLEDVAGAIRCIHWPTEFAEQGELIRPDAIVVIQGTIDRRGGDEANLIVKKVIPLDQLDQIATAGVRLRIQPPHDESTLRLVQQIVRGYPGRQQLVLDVATAEGDRVELESNKRIDVIDELLDRLRDALGSENVQTLIARLETRSAPPPHARPRQPAAV
jgi:DNA polymerase-3 subunit alpha